MALAYRAHSKFELQIRLNQTIRNHKIKIGLIFQNKTYFRKKIWEAKSLIKHHTYSNSLEISQ